jgi:putative transposase
MYRKFKSNNNVVYSCMYHVIWCPKYRRSVLVGEVEKRLKEIVKDVSARCKSEIQEMEIMPDHVHLVIEVGPQYGIHRLVRQLKGVSSHALRLSGQTLILWLRLEVHHWQY